MVGKESDGGEGEEAEDPTGALEGVGEAEDAGADDGDEDVGEGLGVGGERGLGFGEERGGFERDGDLVGGCGSFL